MAEKFKYSDEQLKTLLAGIYSGEISEYNIPEDLYFAIADYLKSGMYQGFGGTLADFSGKDLELLNELRENVYMFSAAKSFTALQQMRDLLINEEGNIKTGREFAKDAAATFENFNTNWGLSERQTAIGQAQMASKWSEIEKNKDILPTLVYDATGEECPICQEFEGLAAPVDDPVWDWATPLLHFNCECVIRQEDSDFPLSSSEDYDKMVDGKDTVSKEFQMNPGKDKIIFSDSHPYFDVQPKDKDFAKENFGLPIPTMKEELSEE